ncbi:hypothetical protein PG995_003718 [Apiospora arundinis]
MVRVERSRVPRMVPQHARPEEMTSQAESHPWPGEDIRLQTRDKRDKKGECRSLIVRTVKPHGSCLRGNVTGTRSLGQRYSALKKGRAILQPAYRGGEMQIQATPHLFSICHPAIRSAADQRSQTYVCLQGDKGTLVYCEVLRS